MKWIKKIIWYHWNPYSNSLTKVLYILCIIGGIIAGIVKKDISGFCASGVCYIMLLCDRGFGEPNPPC